MAKSRAFVDRLEELAWEYIKECIAHTKETLSNKGTLENVKDRHIPTIDYFLNIWIPMNYSKKDTIKRSSYYRWINWDNTYKQKVIKNIDTWFKSLAGDIVANEGKGIFYAKNKLGWSDKSETTIREQPLFGEDE
jgi:uncharacterized protein YaaR (DUF327 family)